jgi:hypothetical protein
MTTPSLTISISRSPLRVGFLFIPLALAWFAFSPSVWAVLPAPEGGYPNRNTAEGDDALFSLTIGDGNTANGSQALVLNTTGSYNIGLGVNAGTNLTTGSNNIDIGNAGVAVESNTIRIGTQDTVPDTEGFLHPAHTATFIAGITGVSVTNGNPVVIDANGQLGTIPLASLPRVSAFPNSFDTSLAPTFQLPNAWPLRADLNTSSNSVALLFRK